MIIQVQDTSEKLIEVGATAWIYTWPGGSHFVVESSALFQWIENETKCLSCSLLARVLNCSHEFT